MTEKKPTHRKHCPWHDYSRACIYHITLVVRDRAALLGSLVEVKDGLPETQCPWKDRAKDGVNLYGKVWMRLTPLGMDVADCIRDIPKFGEKKGLKLKILAQQVMDTHLHFVLYVMEDMKDAVLGDVIRGLKIGFNKTYRRRIGVSGTMCQMNGTGTGSGERGTGTGSGERMTGAGSGERMTGTGSGERMTGAGSGERGTGLFEEDYDDTILTRRGQLQRMLDYVHENPYRKWVKKNNRDCFIPVRGIEIAGKQYDAIGNLMILGLRRFQVHCRYKWEHENDTESRRNHQNECVKMARLNYALVSPFIMEHEKDVMDFCLKEGHSVIVLMDNGFTDYTTCPGGLFYYCDRGQVLLLVPAELPHIDRKGKITRSECVMLNGRAKEIVADGAY